MDAHDCIHCGKTLTNTKYCNSCGVFQRKEVSWVNNDIVLYLGVLVLGLLAYCLYDYTEREQVNDRFNALSKRIEKLENATPVSFHRAISEAKGVTVQNERLLVKHSDL